MSVTITTTYHANANGAGRITAKGRGKQRTSNYDPARSVDANHAAAAGVLGNVVLSPVEQAKVWHPSGRQRVNINRPVSGKQVFTLDV